MRVPLEQLIKLWRATRAPEVSEAVDQASGEGAAPYRASWLAQRKQEAWLQLAKKQAPTDLPALLSTLHDAYSTDVMERLGALRKWDADPRIASAFARLVEKPAHVHLATLPLWQELGSALVQTADARTAARLDAVARLGAGWAQLFRPQMRKPILAWLETTRDQVHQAVARLTCRALTGAERATLKRSTSSLEEALRAVWAQPADLTLRLVYSDMLIAAGDPWGEFIALQCLEQQTSATRKRAGQLLKSSEGKWAGPLAPFVEVHTWERGFPSVVTVRARTRRSLSTVVGHPAWSTIHTIELTPVGYLGTPVEVVTHPSMIHLQRVAGLSDSELRSICRLGTPLPIRSLVIGGDIRLLRGLTPERFPQLTQVHVRGRASALHQEAAAQRGLQLTSGPFELKEWSAPPVTRAPVPVKAMTSASSPIGELATVKKGQELLLDGQPVRVTRIAELGSMHFKKNEQLEAWDAVEMERVRFEQSLPGAATVFAAFAGREAISLKLVFGKKPALTWKKGPRIPEGAEVLVFSASGVFSSIDSYVDEAEELINFHQDVLSKAADAKAGAALVDLSFDDDELELLVWRSTVFGATTSLGLDEHGALAALLFVGARASRGRKSS